MPFLSVMHNTHRTHADCSCAALQVYVQSARAALWFVMRREILRSRAGFTLTEFCATTSKADGVTVVTLHHNNCTV
jgi:hypothetical protein